MHVRNPHCVLLCKPSCQMRRYFVHRNRNKRKEKMKLQPVIISPRFSLITIFNSWSPLCYSFKRDNYNSKKKKKKDWSPFDIDGNFVNFHFFLSFFKEKGGIYIYIFYNLHVDRDKKKKRRKKLGRVKYEFNIRKVWFMVPLVIDYAMWFCGSNVTVGNSQERFRFELLRMMT